MLFRNTNLIKHRLNVCCSNLINTSIICSRHEFIVDTCILYSVLQSNTTHDIFCEAYSRCKLCGVEISVFALSKRLSIFLSINVVPFKQSIYELFIMIEKGWIYFQLIFQMFQSSKYLMSVIWHFWMIIFEKLGNLYLFAILLADLSKRCKNL